MLDPLAAVLIPLRRRAGAVLATAVLLTDAASNAYAVHILHLGEPAAVLVQPVAAAVEIVAAGVAVAWGRQLSSSP